MLQPSLIMSLDLSNRSLGGLNVNASSSLSGSWSGTWSCRSRNRKS